MLLAAAVILAAVSSGSGSPTVVETVARGTRGFGGSESAASGAAETLRRADEELGDLTPRTAVRASVERAVSEGRRTAAARTVAAKTSVKGILVPEKLSEYEQHIRRETLEKEIEGLRHAGGAIGYLEERAANKLRADVDEIDHMIVRQHLLTDRRNETDVDVKALDKHIAVLQKASADKRKEAQAVEEEVDELALAKATLSGSTQELKELAADIKSTTEDGRKMDAKVQKLSRERATVMRQIRDLAREGDVLQEKAETADDFAAFERAGYDDMMDENDPYMKEAEEALEKVSGWDGDKLDKQAVEAREAMTHGLAHNPGQAVGALRAMTSGRGPGFDPHKALSARKASRR